jgi:uncharacterized protein (TIGR02453 family)
MASAPHFTPEFFTFFRDLKRNNDRAWFADNKPRYLEHVEGPMLQFIADFGPRLQKISRAFVADKRRMGGSMFRIYRDTRFAADKSPYKTWTAARFPHEARRKVEGVPAFFAHLGPGDSFGGGGVYHLNMPQLTKIRRAIVESPRDWTKVRTRVDVRGDQLKRAPSGFSTAHEHIEDLKRQNLFAMTTFTDAEVVAPGFIDAFTDACERVAPLVQFQTKAMGLKF